VTALANGIVVISSHLDDAVMSLGASIVRATREGRPVGVLTVFAGKPHSQVPAGSWDRRAGFATEGEAVRARRREDKEACRLVGAEPSWLSFSEADYAGIRNEGEVWSAVTDALADTGAVLVPGFPLTNPDHAWLSRLLLERGLPCGRIGLYAEQPYRYIVRRERPRLDLPAPLPLSPSQIPKWTHPAGALPDLRTKRRAMLAYRSQLPLLGLAQNGSWKLHRMLLHETIRRGEAVAWLPSR